MGSRASHDHYQQTWRDRWSRAGMEYSGKSAKLPSANVYNVTEWSVGNPYEDVGVVINSIIADIKRRQAVRDLSDWGKPGAVIYIPPGDFRLVTQVVIDVSFLRLAGSPSTS